MSLEESASTAVKSRDLYKRETEAESLLWCVLRGCRVFGLEFSRKHPLGSLITDFACVKQKLAIDIDGELSNAVVADDVRREQEIESHGWTVMRFSADDIFANVESVAMAIIDHLGIDTEELESKPR